MRISVQGENFAADQLRGYLRTQGFALSSIEPHYSVTLEEDSQLEGQNYFIVRGIACPLERLVAEHIHELTKKDFICQRAQAKPSDQELTVAFAPADSNAIAQGAFRGLLDLLLPKVEEPAKAAQDPLPGLAVLSEVPQVRKAEPALPRKLEADRPEALIVRRGVFSRIWVWLFGE